MTSYISYIPIIPVMAYNLIIPLRIPSIHCIRCRCSKGMGMCYCARNAAKTEIGGSNGSGTRWRRGYFIISHFGQFRFFGSGSLWFEIECGIGIEVGIEIGIGMDTEKGWRQTFTSTMRSLGIRVLTRNCGDIRVWNMYRD